MRKSNQIPKASGNRIISGIWMVNALGLIALSIFFFTRNNQAHATPAPATQTPTQASTLTITPTPLPSETPTFAPGTPEPDSPSASPTPYFGESSIIGYSVMGRAIPVYRFGNGPVGRFIVAGIHGGNEYNTVLLAYQLIDYVKKNPRVVPKDMTLYILPNLNPDGYERSKGEEGRTNENGVDLNRNWPYRWQADWPRGTCWNATYVTGGDYPASEPETAAVIAFLNDHPEIDSLLSIHSAALGVFAGGVPEFKPSVKLAQKIGKIGKYHYPPTNINCLYTGNLTDWASNTRKIAAVDIEMYDHKYTYLQDNILVLKEFLKYRR